MPRKPENARHKNRNGGVLQRKGVGSDVQEWLELVIDEAAYRKKQFQIAALTQPPRKK